MTVVRRLTEGEGIQLLEDPVLQRLTASARRDVVAYLADLANAARPDRGAGVVAFNPAIAYPDGTVGSRIKAIITGIGAGQPWADVDALVADLVGKLPVAALSTDVQSLLSLIDANAAVVGSVSARIKAETDARTTAIEAEGIARAEAISTAIDGIALDVLSDIAAGDAVVNARITTEVGHSVDRDSALGVRVDNVSARLDSGDIATSIASAASYAYSKAAVDSAIAASSSTLRSEFSTADDGIKARLNAGGDIASAIATASTYAYTKTAADAALASSQTTLRSEFSLADDAIKARLNAGGDIANGIASASTYAYTKAATDGAVSTMGNTVRSEFAAGDAAITTRLNAGGDIANAIADARSYAYTKAETGTAIAALGTTLTSQYLAADGVLADRLNTGDIATALAAASTYAYTKAAANAAVASSIAALNASITGPGGAISAAVSTETSARVAETGVLNAQFALKAVATRADGRKVMGSIGVAASSESDGGYAGSAIVLAADRLLFVPADNINADPTKLLEVGTVNGVTKLRVPGAAIGDLEVTTLKLAGNAVSLVGGASTSAGYGIVEYQLVVAASDLPPGSAVAPVIVTASYALGVQGAFDVSIDQSNTDVPGNLFSASPTSGLWSVTLPITVGAGTHTLRLYYRTRTYYWPQAHIYMAITATLSKR